MKLIGTGLLCILLITGFSTAKAQQSMLDEVSVKYLDTLIKIAKANNPRHKIYAAQVGIAQNNLNRVRLSWLEGIGLYYIYIPRSVAVIDSIRGGTPYATTSTKVNSNPFQFGFSINLGSLFQKPAQISALKGQREVSKLEQQEYELTIESNVKQAYYKYIQQVVLLRKRTQQEADGQIMLTSVKSRFERGQETFDNYTKAQLLYNQQGQDRINTESEMLTAKAQLEELLNKKLEEIILEVK
ncbi:MAG: TolC family protein [Williamsia sp.]|nr:TolC family protein [Williamsia sp.]